jgi:GNAT superfamily N-acetyltransferase
VSEVIVRALASDAEVDGFFRLCAGTFSGDPDPASQGPVWRDENLSAPWHRPERLRGAFRGDELLGGYVIHERWLLIGGARLLTACIGGVVVREEARKLGIGRALMEDAIAFAERERHALLLLDGIPNFYQRFGYADVFDPTRHAIERAAVPRLEPSAYAVRAARPDDAEALLDLYRRHFGTFDRTIEEMRWRLPGGGRHPIAAVDASGRLRGYMVGPGGDHRERTYEVAADDWPAALALLHHHAQLSDAEELVWAIPPHAPLLAWLRDRFPVVSTRTNTPNGDWMARVGHLPTLLDATGLPRSAATIESRALVQLLFGFRPASSVDPALEARFPFGRFWIPASDSF